MQIIILRGIPGSGKTTWRTQRAPMSPYASADAFFETKLDNGDVDYNFDPTLIGQAHAFCLREYTDYLMGDAVDAKDTDRLVVDNTNINVYEIAPYMALGQAYGHDVEIITFLCEPFQAANRNVHGVPSGVVYRMSLALESETLRFPHHWPHKIWRNA